MSKKPKMLNVNVSELKTKVEAYLDSKPLVEKARGEQPTIRELEVSLEHYKGELFNAVVTGESKWLRGWFEGYCLGLLEALGYEDNLAMEWVKEAKSLLGQGGEQQNAGGGL